MHRKAGATVAAMLLALVAGATSCGNGDDEGDASDGGTGSGGVGPATGGEGPGGGAGPHPEPVPFEPACADLAPTQVIGNWDVVPHQTIDARFAIGVVAFHEEGVDVVFAVEGNELARVTNPTWNERTRVYEYWTWLDPADYPDGPLTVSATIEPDCPGHQSRMLEDLPLFANAAGSLTNDTVLWVDCASGDDEAGDGSEAHPYETIEKALVEVGDGGTVQLQAGTCYELTSRYESVSFEQWTTVRPAPGVERAEVQIRASSVSSDTATGRFGQDRVRWQDVGLYGDTDSGYSTILYFESEHVVWFDGAELYEQHGQFNDTNPWGGNDGYRVYLTNTHLHHLANAGYGFGRGVLITDIASDVFRASSNLLSVNLTVRGIDRGETEAHPDFFQLYAPDETLENIVIYNTLVYDMGAQGIFGGEGSLSNAAFVNLLLEKDPADSALTSQLTGDWDHVLLWHLTTVDSGFMLREPENLRNFFIQDNAFANLHHDADTELPGFTIDHNHYAGLVWNQNNGPMGTAASEGEPRYASVAHDDYRPAPDSPLCRSGVPLPGVPADAEGHLYDPEAPARGAFACD